MVTRSHVADRLVFSFRLRLLMAQGGIVVTKTAAGATVKTPTDTLHLTVCGATSIHVVGAPNTEDDGNVLAGTPKEPWMVDACTPAKFTLDIPVEDFRGA